MFALEFKAAAVESKRQQSKQRNQTVAAAISNGTAVAAATGESNGSRNEYEASRPYDDGNGNGRQRH